VNYEGLSPESDFIEGLAPERPLQVKRQRSASFSHSLTLSTCPGEAAFPPDIVPTVGALMEYPDLRKSNLRKQTLNVALK